MYDSGALNKLFLFDIAITEIAPGKFLAAKFVPSKGSTAISNSGPFLVPTFSPIYNIGASSISPSPITIFPLIFILFKCVLIELVAASSATILLFFLSEDKLKLQLLE